MRTPDGWRLVCGQGPWQHLRQAMSTHGERDLLRRSPVVRAWAAEQWPLVLGKLSTQARPISGMWFDKQPEANWRVPWHQDLHAQVLPFDGVEWGPWTVKGGLPAVIAPEPWSSRRLALRLHLDNCGDDDGPLQIIPGPHRHGRLTTLQVEAAVARGPLVTIHAAAGDVLLMHPLLLHRSAPARRPSHRRIVHVEWCDAQLPPNAAWLDAGQ